MAEERMISSLVESCRRNDFYSGWTTFKAVHKSRFLSPTAVAKGKERAFMAINVLEEAFGQAALPFLATDIAKDIFCITFDVITRYKLTLTDLLVGNMLEKLMIDMKEVFAICRDYEHVECENITEKEYDVPFTIIISKRVELSNSDISVNKLSNWVSVCNEFIYNFANTLAKEHARCITVASEEWEIQDAKYNELLSLYIHMTLLHTLFAVMMRGKIDIAKLIHCDSIIMEDINQKFSNTQTEVAQDEVLYILTKLINVTPLGTESTEQTKDMCVIMNKLAIKFDSWLQCAASFFATVTHYIDHSETCLYETDYQDHLPSSLTRDDGLHLLKLVINSNIHSLSNYDDFDENELNVMRALIIILDNTPSNPREDEITHALWRLIDTLFCKYNNVFVKYDAIKKSSIMLKYERVFNGISFCI